MKASFLVVALLLAFGLGFAGDGAYSINANETYRGYNLDIEFYCTVDSVDTLTSNSFRLSKFDHVSWATYPFIFDTKLTSAKGSPKCTLYIQGYTPRTGWATIDTVFSANTSESAAVYEVNLNNKKREKYRLLLYGVALNRSDTTFRANLLGYQETY